MTVLGLLEQLRDARIEIAVEGEHLRLRGRQSALTPELKRALTERKSELIAVLRRAHDVAGSDEIPRVSRDLPPPASFVQRRFWFLDQLEPDTGVHHLFFALRLQGALDVPALAQALRQIVRRHEILRTRFESRDGQLVQVVSDVDVDVPIGESAGSDADPSIEALAREHARRTFDLAEGPPIRLAVVRMGADDHVLLVTIHHVAADAWSVGVFVRELAEFYRAAKSGSPPSVPPLDLQYADFAAWQLNAQSSERTGADLRYWTAQLAGAPALQLPVDRPRGLAASFRGARHPMRFSRELSDRVNALAKREASTVFMVMLAAFAAVLQRYSGQDDILVGSPVAGRNSVQTEPLIGPFINSLVLRVDAGGDPRFRDLLARARAVSLDAFAHQELPFERLVQEMQPDRQANRNPLFQVVLALQNVPLDPLRVPDLTVTPLDIDRGTVTLDQEWFLWETADGLGGQVRYNTDLFDAATIDDMIADLTRVLAAVTENPDQRLSSIPRLDGADLRRVLVDWNATRSEYPRDSGIHEVVQACAARTPEAIAISCEGETRTYRELNEAANRLAHWLRARGVGADALVGVCLDRSPRLPVALLGILKAGGAYVALDPHYPAARLQFMLADTAAKVVLTERSLRSSLPPGEDIVCLEDINEALEHQPATDPICVTGPDHLAYVSYTSGSTGTPKGVAVPHRAVLRLLFGVQYASFGPTERLLHLSPVSFDASTLEIWGALAHGGRCVLLASRLPTPPELARTIAREGVTTLWLTAALFNAIVDAMPEAFEGVRQILTGGEALSVPHVKRAQAHLPFTQIINGYGPTESTTFACCYPIPRSLANEASSVPIGPPIGNTRAYVLDSELRPVPPRVRGELYIGGDGLARGYLSRPDLTADRFVPDPFAESPGGRLYRTGDLVAWRHDGSIEFIGRVDHQVKIRGFRIEPGEIESALRAHAAVREAAVVVREDEPGDKRLVAYLVSGGLRVPVSEMRAFVKERLPEYMLPAAIVWLDRLPLTANGKLDRAALPPPDQEADRGPLSLPGNDLERRIAAVWCDVLGAKSVGVEDNFFDLGGHSLLLIQLQGRLRDAIARELSVVELFQFPTVRALAQYIQPDVDAPPMPAASRRAAPSTVGDIAIIGMAGRFPGAKNVEEFWSNLLEGVEGIARFEDGDLIAAGIPRELLSDPAYVKARGVLADAERFDAAFFGYTPREAELIDPQQRVFLECAWEALEHAGYDAAQFDGRVGVFAGSGANFYLYGLARHPELLADYSGVQIALSNEKDFLPTRVSYKLNLRGPSVSVQTACSTSLVAVHLALRSLMAGDCDIALAGGVRVLVPQQSGYRYEEGSIQSPDGRCRAFDADAKGTVSGSGAAIVVLKPLEKALRDGDTVHAVIKGSAINNDGSQKIGFTAPAIRGQAEVIAEAHRAAGVDPATITYIEAHGTATPLGDPIEIAALTTAFRAHTDARGFCAIGSLKSNVGHLDAAAGAAGLIKAALAVQRGEIPPSLHFDAPNPKIDFAGSPFFVNTSRRAWRPDGLPRRAGVSSFGLGGTNAHAVLEEPPAQVPGDRGRAAQLLILSAKSAPALDTATFNLARHLDLHSDLELADIAHTLQVGRRPMAYRRAVVCRSRSEAIAALSTPSQPSVVEARASVAFMFSGQGSQHVDMGRNLYETEPVFRRHVDQCAEILRPYLGGDLPRLIYSGSGSDADSERLRDTAIAQPALFAIEYALAQLWMSWGVRPDAMIGHSVGEYVAACLAGVMSLDEALALIASRGRLMQATAPGAMLAVPLDEDEATRLFGDTLVIAAVNAPGHVVVAGSLEAIESAERELERRGVDGQRLHTSHAFHSPMMEPALKPFSDQLSRVRLSAPRIPFVSNVTGTWIHDGEATSPEYWVNHLRQTVRFADGVRTLAEEPARVLLEVGPGQTLTSLARRSTPDRTVIASLPRATDRHQDLDSMMQAVGRLWVSGGVVDWGAFKGDQIRRRVPLPTYPFERERYFIELPNQSARPAIAPGTRLAMRDWLYAPGWISTPRPSARQDAVERRWLVFDEGADVGAAVASSASARGIDLVSVHIGESFVVLGNRRCAIAPGSSDDYRALWTWLQTEGFEPDRILHLWSLSTTDESFESQQRLGFHSVVRLLQAVGAAAPQPSLSLTVVTSGGQDVTGAEALRPGAATVLATCKVAGFEYPTIACRALDVADDDAMRCADSIVREALSSATDPLVAYRAGRRWLPAYKRLESPTSPASLRERGVYLITGGFGGVGIEMARSLIEGCRARIALVGRTSLPPRPTWAAWLAEHEESDRVSAILGQLMDLDRRGTPVLVLNADVADTDAMQAAVRQTIDHFGELHGVVHAAGADKSGVLIQQLQESDAHLQFRPRVEALQALDRALDGVPLDFCAIQSSLASILGVVGHCAYGAAHLFVDAYVAARNRTARVRWTTIDWDNWRTWKSPAADRSATDLVMTAEEGRSVFRAVLALEGVQHVAVSTGDLDSRVARWTSPRPKPADKPQVQEPAGGKGSRPALKSEYAPPRDDRERILCAIWERLLGIAPIGIRDNFFELGGDSVLGIQVVSRATAAGLRLNVGQMFEHQTVADLASVARVTHGSAAGGTIPARARLTPIQRWFFERDFTNPHRFNQARFFEIRGSVPAAALQLALQAAVDHHDGLRLRFEIEGGEWHQVVGPRGPAVPFKVVDLTSHALEARPAIIERAANELHENVNFVNGPVLGAVYFECGAAENSRLLLSAHHLVVDAVSWRTLLEDLETACRQALKGEIVRLEPATSFTSWAEWLNQRSWSADVERQTEFWIAQASAPTSLLPCDLDGENTEASADTIDLTIPADETGALVRALPERGGVAHALAAALAMSCLEWSGGSCLRIDFEGHGREPLGADLDVSRTVGWFTALYPVAIELDPSAGARTVLAEVRRQLSAVPHGGIGYGLLRYLSRAGSSLLPERASDVSFLYFGRQDARTQSEALFAPARDSIGANRDPHAQRAHTFEFTAYVLDDALHVHWRFSRNRHHYATVRRLADRFAEILRAIVRDAHIGGSAEISKPEQFPAARLSARQLQGLLTSLKTPGRAKQ